MSLARQVYDGVETFDGKIYTIGGRHSSNVTLVERYDPASNQWETITSLSVARSGLATAVMDGKLLSIGGSDDLSVEIYDPTTGQWAAGTALPATNYNSTALFNNDSIWTPEVTPMVEVVKSCDLLPTRTNGPRSLTWQPLVQVPEWFFLTKRFGQSAERPMDSTSTRWKFLTSLPIVGVRAPSLTVPRQHPMAWTAHGKIYVAGGRTSNWT